MVRSSAAHVCTCLHSFFHKRAKLAQVAKVYRDGFVCFADAEALRRAKSAGWFVYHFGRFRESLAPIGQDFKLFSCLFHLAAVKSLSTPETVEPGKDNWMTWHFVHRLHGQNEQLCKIKKGDLKINGTTSQSCGLPPPN